MTDHIYDIETYMDLFSVAIVNTETAERFIFEVSDRIDQSAQFVWFIRQLRGRGDRLFGFNNEMFDWVVCQTLIDMGTFTCRDAYAKAQQIFERQRNDRFGLSVWPDQRTVPQGDLFKIHHFDNMARSTSLKKLEINMRSRRVVDLPYPPDQPTTSAQKDEIIAYMCHDVHETLKFYWASKDQIAFRDDLAVKYPDMGDVLNMNDTKIGKQFFIRELERNGTPCFERRDGRRQPIQTRRSEIHLRDVISPKVSFQHPEFQRILAWMQTQTLVTGREGFIETKGVFDNVSCTVGGVEYEFGTGGIHGAIANSKWYSDGTRQVQGRDVASYYPNLSISNRFYPAHLGETFCDVYKMVYDMRRQHPKGTAENAMLKLALNGVYGDSNNKYSPFYDPQYTMSITINGQLMLCMLVEKLIAVESLQMIQVNTDGLEYVVDKVDIQRVNDVCLWWENHTGLELETENYSMFLQRDVNSYICVVE